MGVEGEVLGGLDKKFPKTFLGVVLCIFGVKYFNQSTHVGNLEECRLSKNEN